MMTFVFPDPILVLGGVERERARGEVAEYLPDLLLVSVLSFNDDLNALDGVRCVVNNDPLLVHIRDSIHNLVKTFLAKSLGNVDFEDAKYFFLLSDAIKSHFIKHINILNLCLRKFLFTLKGKTKHKH